MPRRSNIEDIILSHDRRGISSLRPYLPSRFCDEAASLIMENNGGTGKTALITTGFYIPAARAAETDGPPGALALATALKPLGFEAFLVTDKYTSPLLKPISERVIIFPLKDEKGSLKYAFKILKDIKPSIIISVERCGLTASGRYLNMRGVDISPYNARMDYLFMGQGITIGIGDGGNEIGMGNLADKIKSAHNLPGDPCITEVHRLILSSVSNWGAYGLIASLSLMQGRNLLPSLEWQREILRQMVDRGAVDGISGERKCSVDGFSEEQNSQVLARLHKLVEERLGK